MAPPAQIILETEAVVAVAKPSGVAVHRGWAEDPYPLLQRVRDTLGGTWVHAAHRLDRATSGVVLFTRSAEHAAKLAASFRTGRVDKRYLAFTRGVVPELGLVDHPIPRFKSKASERVPAQTRFVRLAVAERFSWVAARPLTGRLHQIRRHFKHLSHPLVGDVRYGKGDINRRFRSEVGLDRLALHAHGIGFEDPETGAWHQITAPVPPDLAEPLAAFGLPRAALDFDPWQGPVDLLRNHGLRPSPKGRDFPAP